MQNRALSGQNSHRNPVSVWLRKFEVSDRTKAEKLGGLVRFIECAAIFIAALFD
jgi:hypothetical protein